MAHTILSSMCRSCRHSYTKQVRHAFSSTARKSEERVGLAERRRIRVDRPKEESSSLDPFSETLRKASPQRPQANIRSALSPELRDIARSARDEAATRPSARVSVDEPYHLNVYAHKHNLHITFTDPSRNPIMSLSCGNIGLRKAQRASYDAAFQLAAYTFRKMAEKQWRVGGKKMTHNAMKTLADIRRPGAIHGGTGIEVILRGFGPGREAFQKALLGTEGRVIKPLIGKVTDGTRLKFGGTRSPKVRRLG
ncbi:hypothetical protein PV11_07036 [Exophiala sideris]|uniref:Ribosomal protein S11 n=1 Tax=Exophiala sideris TaxID=1016849 RepID=A0A0D1YF65_9EURO|nr:hypothetical protein PV11_07036 [Exophiala sideris]